MTVRQVPGAIWARRLSLAQRNGVTIVPWKAENGGNMSTDTLDLQAILRRIERLEAENRRLKRVGLFVAALAAVVFGMAQAKPKLSAGLRKSGLEAGGG